MNKCWYCGIDTANKVTICNLFICNSCYYVFNNKTFSLSLLVAKVTNVKWILDCKQEYFELQELG